MTGQATSRDAEPGVTTAGPAVWDQGALCRYGPSPDPAWVGRVLAMFRERAGTARAALAGSPRDRRTWAGEAHVLVATSGMLGFDRLCAESRRVQHALRDEGAVPGPGEWTLIAAIDEALAAAGLGQAPSTGAPAIPGS